MPFGVTLHAIDKEVDRGTLLKAIKVPVFSSDTLRDVADRCYRMECDLLANSEPYLPFVTSGDLVGDQHPVSHEKIPGDVDAKLESVFLEKCDHFVEICGLD